MSLPSTHPTRELLLVDLTPDQKFCCRQATPERRSRLRGCPSCLLHRTRSPRTFSRFVSSTAIANRPLLTEAGDSHQRAQELLAVGQSQATLQLLHEHVTSKRSRNSPLASLEPVMLLFVELAVELRKGKLAKDGLYQYKNMAQNTNVGTIEVCPFSRLDRLAPTIDVDDRSS